MNRFMSVSQDRRTAIDWAQQLRKLIDLPRYATAETLTIVCDNLNTHTLASLYQAFEPREARRIRNKVRIVYTPKHGSWLNMAEPELSVLTRQCLSRRIDNVTEIEQEVSGHHNETINKLGLTGNSLRMMHASNSSASTRNLNHD